MARTRTIKPGFFMNEELAELSCEARLLFIGLWTIADSEGRLEDRPRKIKASVFPYDDCDVDTLLGLLDGKKFLRRYRVNEQRYIQITNFGKTQKPRPKEGASETPAAFIDRPEAPNQRRYLLRDQDWDQDHRTHPDHEDSLASETDLAVADPECREKARPD